MKGIKTTDYSRRSIGLRGNEAGESMKKIL